ncbi:hypothetical protein F1C10_07830 [Sphingomonas sp. NBWT7]|nr:hypothetical protein F1C10_07830 [Sphingomonas sp. NBWT7]
MIALAIREVAQAGPNGAESVAAAPLADDCCVVYSGWGEHQISDIAGSMSVARHIVTIQWNTPRHTHLYVVSLGDDFRAIDITGH